MPDEGLKRRFTIGILLGGASSEKEISLESGRHVYNSLNRKKYVVIPIFVDHNNHLWEVDEGLLWMNTCADIEGSLSALGKRIYYEELKEKLDFAFLALHGKFGEDCFPGLFHLLDIPNNSGGVLGGSVGMDKYFQKKILKAAGLQVPKYIGVEKNWNENTLQQIEKEIGYPCIVKPSREGCSIGLTKINHKSQFAEAFEKAFCYDNLILVEEFIEGQEITVTVLGNALPVAFTPTETPSKKDYLTVEEKFLPGDATMITPPNLPPAAIERIKSDCIKVYKALGLKSMTRIDGIFKDGRFYFKRTKNETKGVRMQRLQPMRSNATQANQKTLPRRQAGASVSEGVFYILEPNTPPGMTPSTCVFHQAAEADLTASELLDKIISDSMV